MIRVSQLGLAVGMALSAAAAHADPASASLYQRLFKPNVPEQFRTDALAFALASAWQARGCQVEPALAEVMAAGLARETNVARFEQKLGLVADAGCGAGAQTPPAEAPSGRGEDPAAALIASVAEGRSKNTQVAAGAPAYAAFSAIDAQPKPASPAESDAQKPDEEKKDDKDAELKKAHDELVAIRDSIRHLIQEHEHMSNPTATVSGEIKTICHTLEVDPPKKYDGPTNANGKLDRPESVARCSNLVYQEIARGYQRVVEGAKAVETLHKDADPKILEALKTLALDLQPRVEYAAALEASTRSANYGLYVGPSQVLQDDGKWKEGSEYLLRFNTEVFDSESTGYDSLCLLRKSWCRGYTDISYTSPGVLPKEVEDPSVPPNPFKQEGTLRVRAGIISHSNPWFGMEYGIGLSSPIEDGNDFSRVEPMARVGAHFQTLYNDGVVGELSVGLAHDRSRTYLTDKGTADNPIYEDEFNRLYLEGTVLFPRAEILGGWRLAGRLSMDAPINGDSEAEVRASVLVYYPLSNWLDTFKPVQAKPAP
ncbi:MAG: hypothetical protein U1F26_15320 [Lysobacterales bacterium]